MSERVNRFLGDTPMRTFIKLLVLSLILGFVMSTLGWSPLDVIDGFIRAIRNLWEMGFEALGRFGEYIVLGAVIVVPLFLLLRLLRFRA